jgi:glycosyltransferase involved in cell wall biosynthesis
LKADYYVFQTQYARNSYLKRTKKNPLNSKVIPNAFDPSIIQNISKETFNEDKYIIFCPGAPYIHKGIQFIPEIAFQLEKLTSIDFEFVITIPDGEFLDKIVEKSKELNILNKIRNVGLVSYSEISNLYKNCSVVFVPSFLETFSATYLEAIIFEKPLIVNDLNFAKDICGDFAKYVDCSDSELTAKCLLELNEKPLSKDLLTFNKLKLAKSFLNQEQRSNLILEEILSKLDNQLKN